MFIVVYCFWWSFVCGLAEMFTVIGVIVECEIFVCCLGEMFIVVCMLFVGEVHCDCVTNVEVLLQSTCR